VATEQLEGAAEAIGVGARLDDVRAVGDAIEQRFAGRHTAGKGGTRWNSAAHAPVTFEFAARRAGRPGRRSEEHGSAVFTMVARASFGFAFMLSSTL